jgi:hypothetical protein
VTQNDLVDEELGCVSCPEQIHIFVQPISIKTLLLIIAYPPARHTHHSLFIINNGCTSRRNQQGKAPPCANSNETEE